MQYLQDEGGHTETAGYTYTECKYSIPSPPSTLIIGMKDKICCHLLHFDVETAQFLTSIVIKFQTI
jgi:hypothetical protein